MNPKIKFYKKIEKLLPSNKNYYEPHFHYDDNFLNQKSDSILNGYFQSKKYFENISNDIRKNFILKNNISENSKNIAEKIKSSDTSISLHIRRGDYISDTKNSKRSW